MTVGEDGTAKFEEEKSSKDLSNIIAVDKEEESTVNPTMAMMTISGEFKDHVSKAMEEMKEENRRDSDKILSVLQQESHKRSALEQRLHSQLLLQNEFMVAMELKLMRLEAKVERREALLRQQQQQQQQQQRNPPTNSNINGSNNTNNTAFFHHRPPAAFQTIDESSVDLPASSHESASGHPHNHRQETPPNMAVISSGASLASGVTAGSFLVDDGDDVDDDDEDQHDNDSNTRADDTIATEGEPVVREGVGSQHSTPTQGSSRPRVAVGENGTLESLLLNPMLGEAPSLQWSVRATRGPQDTDGNSSLATSVTNSTFTSTVVTSTTRGDNASMINVRRILPEEELEMTPSRRGRSTASVEEVNMAEREDEPRSRSQSPLTVHSHGSENLSMASASTVGTSIRSTVAVAPRNFGRRAISALSASSESSRPLANRVVTFTTEPTNTTTNTSASLYNIEAGDSITLPDEIDNFSEVADAFANNARQWRDDYEARLEALQKKWEG